MKIISKLISLFFHPLILVFVLMSMAFWMDRYAYYLSEPKEIGLLFIMNFALLVLFPMVGVGMLAGLKMISGITMPRREDRIGPLIITLTFYIWYFINIKNNSSYPDTLRFAALGAALSVGLAFFINNFSKISLHAIGAGSFCAAFLVLILTTETSLFDIYLLGIGGFRVSAIFVFLLCILLAGAVGASRLYLRAHKPNEVYGGYLVGIVAQLIAFRMVL